VETRKFTPKDVYMSTATIRQNVINQFINPARSAGTTDILIRAGDVQNALNLQNQMPAVCLALGAEEFEKQAGVRRIAFDGPIQGADAKFWFRLLDNANTQVADH
jgi:hypothetical protein